MHHNETDDMDYDDGEKERMVKADLIKPRDSNSNRVEPKQDFTNYKEGGKIEARYRGRNHFFPGTITHVHHDGTYDIDYDDGEEELMVRADLIRPKSSSNVDKGLRVKFEEGSEIEARYKGRSKYYPGIIACANHNGTYDIEYDDGEKERMVKSNLIRQRNSNSNSNRVVLNADVTMYKEGDEIEARYKGRSRFYPGVIARVHHNETYDIDYDDGEKERMVLVNLIQRRCD